MTFAAAVQIRLFEEARGVDQIAIDAQITRALQHGARVVYNLSGGKDSGAAAIAVDRHLDAIGHPRELRLAIHADLGRAEWRETQAMVEQQAEFIGVPLITVRRKAGDMVQRWEQRFASGLSRYTELLTYNLIGPWSSASLRFCTSELKAQVIGPHIAREFRGDGIVQVVGIRREESAARAAAPIAKPDHRYAKPGNRAGTQMLMWHPIVEWSLDEVLDCHARHGMALHPAYTAGCSRVSCAFCIMQSVRDAQAAASVAGNIPLYLHLVEIEATSTFSFWPDRWLSDIAPGLLSPALAALVERGKRLAAERQAIEAAMPAGLRYVKGWPARVPTYDEAVAIADARHSILGHHGQPNHFHSPQMIIDRFADLMALRAAKEAA